MGVCCDLREKLNMKNDPISKIEPLVSDLKSLSLGNFLQSNEYKRYLIKAGLDES